MACRGVLFSITDDQSQKLRSAFGDDEAVLEIVQIEIEEAWDTAHLCETDKAWDAIHRCLGDGTINPNNGPLSFCILGGEHLHLGDTYIISLLRPEQVKILAAELKPLDREWFRDKYFKIDPSEYGFPGGLGEEDFEYTWYYFEEVRKFYEQAALESRWTFFSVDQ